MEPNAPKDPLDPTPSPLPSFSEVLPPPSPPQPPSEPFVPPAPPASPPAPLTGSTVPPSSFEIPPGATPPPPVSSFMGSDAPPPPPPLSSLPSGEFASVTPAVPSTKEERLWATLIHLSGVVGLFGFAGATFGLPIPMNIVLPLVLWLVKREGNPFIDQQGKEVLNFQITVFLLCLLLFFTCIGIPLLIVVGIASLVLSIIGSIKANEGVAYRYPLSWRVIS